MRRILIVAAVLSVVGVACGQGSRPPADADRSLLPKDRLALPEFTYPQFQALIEELRGTPVVVNVWGSWCPPCRVEAPDLAEVSEEFEGEVQFLGVDIEDTRESARRFILEFDWQYPSVFDPDREIPGGLGLFGQPITVIFDREGQRAFEWIGAVTGDQLREEIRKVL